MVIYHEPTLLGKKQDINSSLYTSNLSTTPNICVCVCAHVRACECEAVFVLLVSTSTSALRKNFPGSYYELYLGLKMNLECSLEAHTYPSGEWAYVPENGVLGA